jgi:hypothetical protein
VTFSIIKLSKKECAKFIKEKHYTRKESIFWCGFGLVENGMVEGVVVYGQPSPPIQKHAFSDRDFKLYELSRLVIQTKSKNAASFLIANSLNMLEKPCAVVSYADSSHGHCGIVYQATNWIYTGFTISHDNQYKIGDEIYHRMSIRDMGITNVKQWIVDNSVEVIKPKEKHRYFYICANKRTKQDILSKLKYQIISEYPKTNKTRYDDGTHIVMPK